MDAPFWIALGLAMIPIRLWVQKFFSWYRDLEARREEEKENIELYSSPLLALIGYVAEALFGFGLAFLIQTSFAGDIALVMGICALFLLHLRSPFLGFSQNPHYYLFFMGLVTALSPLLLLACIVGYVLGVLVTNSRVIAELVAIIALFVPLYILDLEAFFFVVVGFFSVLFLVSLPSIFRVLDGQKDSLLRAYEER
jgi:putative flippase GtrA